MPKIDEWFLGFILGPQANSLRKGTLTKKDKQAYQDSLKYRFIFSTVILIVALVLLAIASFRK